MLPGLYEIINVFTGLFTTSILLANSSLALPLPQHTSYVDTIKSQLQRTVFSTDYAAGLVLAEKTGKEGTPDLRVYITNNQTCVREGEQLSYQVVVRNFGNATAQNVSVQFQHPQTTTFRDSDPKPTRPELPEVRLIEWFVPELIPGATTTYSIILVVNQPTENVTVKVTVLYTDAGGQRYQTLSSHTIDGPCTTQPAPASLIPRGQPAIICERDKAGQLLEPNCVDTYAGLKLGPNYQRVLDSPANQGVDCGEFGCTRKPELGVRFAEAIADILPGECRVIEDDIIVQPEFHDALNRRADPAAAYLFPLYRSGQDFRGFVVENEIMGNQHQQVVVATLREVADKNWQEHYTLLTNLANEEEGVTPANVLNKFEDLSETWIERVEDSHEKLLQDYKQLQNKRKDSQFFTPGACGAGRFARIACQAIENAKQSIVSACGPPPLDGGLSGLLPGVYQAYDQSLNTRLDTYPETQRQGIRDYRDQIAAWRIELQAINSTAGDDLSVYGQLHLDSSLGWRALLRAYTQHDRDDLAAATQIRLRHWERALDSPKGAATACEKENIFPPKVATTWCEVGQEPELIIREAPDPAKKPIIQVPRSIEGGSKTFIPDAAVLGDVCGLKPGDPFWTPSCKCHCGQQVVCKGKVVRCEDLFECTLDPRDKITHHDCHVTSQLECLWEEDDHISPDAPGENLPLPTSLENPALTPGPPLFCRT